MNVVAPTKVLAKDFASDQEVRWCPGCGDYAIVSSVQRTLAELNVAKDKTVFVSGIGCAARFPYYMATYGFHTIHGRAPAVATGVKLANPELDVWVISGDGDSLSIGGNHLLHMLRRNIDLQFLLFNNEIYGLTKGQYSPTSRVGTQSPSTPMGSVEYPIQACSFALGAGAHFVARSVDTMRQHLPEVLKRAHAHKGTSFVEILQNCIVYNDGVYAAVTEKDVAEDAQLHLQHGQPMIFGKAKNRGLRLKPGALELEVVTVGEGGVLISDILVHDETNRMLGMILASLEAPNYPVALGVIYCKPGPTYEASVAVQVAKQAAKFSKLDVNALLRRGHTWTVAP
ncbi:MAG: 2-oxoacid:ferredoxin oxidoreductase subunit beta [Rhodospirillales bacterium]|nr:2-oxoacid:ferredoxin oxidoreductase subunit beta [Rhodospirillales bacterium]